MTFCYILLAILSFLILVFLFFYIHFSRYTIEILLRDKYIIKPLTDDRKYRFIRLTNGLDSFLISDTNTGVCAASLTVGAGSFQDDDDIPGLAHFTEHMIYLGSKSNKPGDFEEYLSNYFGITNAYTENEKTTFYFQVGCKGFIKALYMFSRMFAEPLFDVNFMNKEINSVNSENCKNSGQDPWRQHQLLKQMSNPLHPFYRFNTGNNETLEYFDEKTLNYRLRRFYDKFYIPKNMKFVVLANLDIDTIQYEVSQYFSDIRLDSLQNDLPPLYGLIKTNESPFTSEYLGKIVWYKKITSVAALDLVFYLDEVISHYKTKPTNYISYLLKHTGPGSLFKTLDDKRLVTKIDAGLITTFKNFSLFSVSIELTDEGFEDPMSVITTTFAYLNNIRNKDVSEKIYDEIHRTSKIRFKFSEKKENYGDYLASLSSSMFDYNYKEILYADEMHTNFNSTIIKSFIKKLTPSNCLLFLGSNRYPNNMKFLNQLFTNSKNKTEVWYKTKYIDSKLDLKILEELTKTSNFVNFIERTPNNYITSQDNIVSCLENNEQCYEEINSIKPTMYYNQTNLIVWHKLDRSFLIPKVIININIISPFFRNNPSDYLVFNILFNYISDRLESLTSDLKETGNDLEIKFSENGYFIQLYVFTDLVDQIMTELLEVIFNPKINAKNFKDLLKITLDELKQTKDEEPRQKAERYFTKILKFNVTTPSEIYSKNELQDLSYLNFNSILESRINTFSVNTLFYGSMTTSALKIQIEKMRKYLKNSSGTKIIPLIEYLHAHKLIPVPVIFRISNDLKNERDDVVVNYFQVGVRDYKHSLIMNIIEMIWGNMFYYRLRTIEQLGYNVSANKQIIDNNMYFVFLVQGNKKNPVEMNLEIDQVLWRLRDKIISIPDKKFIEILNSIKTELMKKDTNLKERVKKVWSEIENNTLDFKRKEYLLQEIDLITKSDILKAFDEIFIDDPKKMSIQIYASNLFFNKDNQEVYYLNANLNYHVTQNVAVLDSLED